MANRFGTDYQNGGDDGMGNFSAASPTGENRRRPTDEQTLVPVTIKMIREAKDGVLSDGRHPHHLKIVAAVREVTKTSTAYNYVVEDGTGCIDVKDWADDSNLAISQMREEAAHEHQYIRIIGQIKSYEGNSHVQAFSVRKLSSGNEFTHHFLEVVHEGEKYLKGGEMVGTPAMAATHLNFNNEMKMQPSTPIQNGAVGGGDDALKEAILAFVNRCNDDAGANSEDFIRLYQGPYNAKEITEKFKGLAEDGILYSTSDDFHWQTVGADR